MPKVHSEEPDQWESIRYQGADRLFESLAPLSTNLSPRIVLGRHVDSPLDLERRNPANWRGSCHGGASTPEQSGYFPPVAGSASPRPPTAGPYPTRPRTPPGGSRFRPPRRAPPAALRGGP